MVNELLVRNYNVGCGDCTYVRIPNGDDCFHILIDCGSKEGFSTGLVERAVRNMVDELLPPAQEQGKKRLDLIVVTHRHEDHINGFDPDLFEDVVIGNIWLTAAMDESHAQAQRTRAFHEFAAREARSMAQSAGLSPELQERLGMYQISNSGAIEALTRTLPSKSGIEPQYVSAGKTSDDYGIEIEDTKLVVLAPELDIDGYYLGREADDALRGLQEARDESQHLRSSKSDVDQQPTNISVGDFRKLKSRLVSNGLAFVTSDSSIQNNVSTVLLIEWRGRRLLFVGDAEWKGKYREGKKNGSWNVMWNHRKEWLSTKLDFFKIGHHGSHNATPWSHDLGPEHEISQLFDTLLPLPEDGEEPTARCVVSTKRKQYLTIPDGELMAELGKRVANSKNYLEQFLEEDPQFDPMAEIFNYSVMKKYSSPPKRREVGEVEWLDKPQPQRTDMESEGKGDKNPIETVEYIDIVIDP